jgi:hypothetical protein
MNLHGKTVEDGGIQLVCIKYRLSLGSFWQTGIYNLVVVLCEEGHHCWGGSRTSSGRRVVLSEQQDVVRLYEQQAVEGLKVLGTAAEAGLRRVAGWASR